MSENKQSIPFRSFGYIFPSKYVQQMRTKSESIISDIVSAGFTGYITIGFIMGKVLEVFDVDFGLNHLIL